MALPTPTENSATMSISKFEDNKKCSPKELLRSLGPDDELDDEELDEEPGEVWNVEEILQAQADIKASRRRTIPLSQVKALNGV